MTVNHGLLLKQFYHFSTFVEYKPLISQNDKTDPWFCDFSMKSVFTHVACIYANLLKQKKAFT